MSRPKNSFDIIIIGAGSIGTPAAFFLAQAGKKVLVIDQRTSVGQGSNKSAIGGVRAAHSDPAKIRICLRSLDILSRWKERYGDSIEWFKGGYTFVAYSGEEAQALRDLLVLQHQYGLNIQWQDSRDLLKLIPDLNPNGLVGGTYSPDDGHASPLLAAHAFYAHSRRLGAEFHFRETVKSLVMEGSAVQGVKTDQAEYRAEVVVNAAGAWAADLGKMSGLDLPVRPDSHEAAVTEPVAHFLDSMIVDMRPMPGSANYYFYQHAQARSFSA